VVSPALETLGDVERVFVVGSGGVGKTTVAAGLAIAAARDRDVRALVITVDPARRLQSALGLARLGLDPVAVPLDGLDPKGRLDAASIDMKRTWDGIIARWAPSTEVRERLLASPIYEHLSSRFIGSYDYAAVEVLAEVLERGGYDLVVVDTPPSRNALDVLDAPRRLREFFASNLLRLLTLPRRARAFSLAARPFFLVAEAVLGSAFLEDVTTFFADFSALAGPLGERARRLEELLGAPETGFLVVTAPLGPSVREADRLDAELGARGLRVVGRVVNRCWPSEFFPDGAAAAIAWLRGGEGLARLAEALGGDVAGATRVSAELAGVYAELVGAWAARAPERVNVLELPLTDAELTSPEALTRLLDRARASGPAGRSQ
jgi:anion-transporting  ArsA/GET3 family ATPase